MDKSHKNTSAKVFGIHYVTKWELKPSHTPIKKKNLSLKHVKIFEGGVICHKNILGDLTT